MEAGRIRIEVVTKDSVNEKQPKRLKNAKGSTRDAKYQTNLKCAAEDLKYPLGEDDEESTGENIKADLRENIRQRSTQLGP